MTPYVTFAGYSGSGKTTLVLKIITYLKEKGFKIATLKHDGHDFEMDKKGKDTYCMKQAGADCIAISSSNKYALIADSSHRLTFLELMKKIPQDMDIIVGEGFKDENVPKILVHRKEINKPNLYSIEKNIIAVATDSCEEFDGVNNVFHINDYEKIGDFIISYIKNYN